MSDTSFPIDPPIEPMLATLADDIPDGNSDFLFEPKWDGFRAIVFRGTTDVYIQSRDLKPLDRYFPELSEALRTTLPPGCAQEGLVGKRLELLTLAVQGLSRVAVLWQPGGGAGERAEKDMLKEAEVAARALGVRVQFIEARGPADLDRAFSEMTGALVGALTVVTSSMFFIERRRLVGLAAKNRLPAVYGGREFVEAGGLISYGLNTSALFRHAATYVNKILKGAKPGDLPIEQPTKFELMINLKTAKALGLTIPQALLARADQVVE